MSKAKSILVGAALLGFVLGAFYLCVFEWWAV
jgi:hypothetical protein